jgi:hypothetical protein
MPHAFGCAECVWRGDRLTERALRAAFARGPRVDSTLISLRACDSASLGRSALGRSRLNPLRQKSLSARGIRTFVRDEGLRTLGARSSLPARVGGSEVIAARRTRTVPRLQPHGNTGTAEHRTSDERSPCGKLAFGCGSDAGQRERQRSRFVSAA